MTKEELNIELTVMAIREDIVNFYSTSPRLIQATNIYSMLESGIMKTYIGEVVPTGSIGEKLLTTTASFMKFELRTFDRSPELRSVKQKIKEFMREYYAQIVLQDIGSYTGKDLEDTRLVDATTLSKPKGFTATYSYYSSYSTGNFGTIPF